MLLKEIIKNLNCEIFCNNLNLDIKRLEINSKNCKSGYMFFCINGFSVNGYDYLEEAIKNGAEVVVVENKVNIDINQLVVKDVRLFMSLCAKNFYNCACDKLKVIGITGTNGKTTTSYIIKSCLQKKYNVGLIGTNGSFYNDVELKSELTTPDPIKLHKLFLKMLNLGAEYVVMEVSAHSIYLNKIAGIKFDTLCLTNITNEHLDFFGTFQNYEKTKLSIFNKDCCNFAILNSDIKNFASLSKNINVKFSTFALNNPSDTFAINVEYGFNTKFVANSNDEILFCKTNLLGEFNVYNTLLAIAVLKHYDISDDDIINTINFIVVPGRQQIIKYGNSKVIIDFAHTPDGILNILKMANNVYKNKIVTLFGCVGYADENKIVEMVKIALENSNKVIFTTDNPNFKDFKETLKLLHFALNKNFIAIENRKKAVCYALENLEDNSTLLLLGKGNENFQLVKGKYEKYNEYEIVNNYILNNK